MANDPIDTTQANPFELVAYLLFKVRHSLEEDDALGHPPRWIRIVRAREAKTDVIGSGVMRTVSAFANGVSYMADLCLRLRELLLQTDAGKALLEVSLDLLAAATAPNFIAGVKTLVNQDASTNPAAGVNDVITRLQDGLKYIPEPEDLDRLGHELYRLLCCEQYPFPRAPNTSIDASSIPPDGVYVDLDRSGKLRLMQWAYDSPLTVYCVGPKDQPRIELLRLGTRWLWQTAPASLPRHTLVRWPADKPRYIIYEFAYDQHEPDVSKQTKDIQEAYLLLEALGYKADTSTDRTSFTAGLARLLQKFQHINDLPKTGELDNATLNRLMNLDFAAKNLCRALPYDEAKISDLVIPDRALGGYLELVNPDAERPDDEGLTVITPSPGYAYYVCGAQLPFSGNATLPRGRGWISYVASGATPDVTSPTPPVPTGFVALESRRRPEGTSNTTANLEGGILTEGEAALGRFFFCARGAEPWIPGRHGTPGSDPKYQNTPPLFNIQGTEVPWSGMYQWVNIKFLMSNRPSEDHDLVLRATVLRRSLYTDRSKNTGLPDQGVILLSIYDDASYHGYETRFELGKAKTTKMSSLFPDTKRTTAELTESQVDRARTWILQTTPEVVVPSGGVAALVLLAGQRQSGYDIDAYFDNVMVRWDYVHRSPA